MVVFKISRDLYENCIVDERFSNSVKNDVMLIASVTFVVVQFKLPFSFHCVTCFVCFVLFFLIAVVVIFFYIFYSTLEYRSLLVYLTLVWCTFALKCVGQI